MEDRIRKRTILINADIEVNNWAKINNITDPKFIIREFNDYIHKAGIKENYTFEPDRKRWKEVKEDIIPPPKPIKTPLRKLKGIAG